MSTEGRNAVDTYLLQRAGASKVCAGMIAGIDDKAKNYIAEGEKAVRDDLPVIEEANRNAISALQNLDATIRLSQSTNWDIYTDPQFVKAMRGEVTRYCCAMVTNPGARKGLVYQKLKHSGGGDPSSFQNNDLNSSGGGGGGGGRGRGGGGGGGGHGGHGGHRGGGG